MGQYLGKGWFADASMGGIADKVWIGAPSGEGGDFDRLEFEAVLTMGRLFGDIPQALDRYFWENF